MRRKRERQTDRLRLRERKKEREREREREREGDREKEILFPCVSFKEHAANLIICQNLGMGTWEVFEMYTLKFTKRLCVGVNDCMCLCPWLLLLVLYSQVCRADEGHNNM